jgi:hypothetical protein
MGAKPPYFSAGIFIKGFLWAVLFLIAGAGIGAGIHYISAERDCFENGGCWDQVAGECRDGRDPNAVRLCKRR